MRDDRVALLPPWISFPDLHQFSLMSRHCVPILKTISQNQPAHHPHAEPNWFPCWQTCSRSINLFFEPSLEADSLIDKGNCCRPSCVCLRSEICSSKVNHVLLPDKGIEQLQRCCKSISSELQTISQAEVVVGARIPDAEI